MRHVASAIPEVAPSTRIFFVIFAVGFTATAAGCVVKVLICSSSLP
jgi:uncharacterized membrane protein